MSPQRYAAVNQQDHDDEHNDRSPIASSSPSARPRDVPASPPPSFRSRTSSPSSRRLLQQDPLTNDSDRDLADAFDDDDASDDEHDGDDRQRLMRTDTSRSTSIAGTTSSQSPQHAAPSLQAGGPAVERRVTELPAFQPQRSARVIPGVTAPKPAADGVFANLSAKPSAGETLDDKPPTYEQAAADATPPYWETTILAPGMNSDEVYINGLPVGSLFSFIWNGMISMSFLFPGFLLTYLLHTTHAAKNGSLAGLGLTLVQYGFYMRGGKDAANPDAANPGQFAGTPPDPNSHTFDPSNPTGAASSTGSGGSSTPDGFGSADFISYALMIIGWFILIRAVTAFLRARREEQLVLQSPARGLSQAVVAEGEGERAV